MNTPTRWPRLRVFTGLLGLIIGVLLVTLATIDTATAGKASRWQLVDWSQQTCVSIGSPYSDRTTYYGIYLNGRWNQNITAGLRNAPSGSTQWGLYLPVRPGSSNGEYSLAYVALQLAADTPLGFYTINLWAGDGATRQTVPVVLEVAEDCGY